MTNASTRNTPSVVAGSTISTSVHARTLPLHVVEKRDRRPTVYGVDEALLAVEARKKTDVIHITQRDHRAAPRDGRIISMGPPPSVTFAPAGLVLPQDKAAPYLAKRGADHEAMQLRNPISHTDQSQRSHPTQGTKELF